MTDSETSSWLAQYMKELYESPTEEAWEAVLEALVDGDVYYAPEYLGDIVGFINTKVANSKHPVQSELARDHALERRVGRWDFKRELRFPVLERRLDLIVAYRPPSGFHKILAQLQSPGYFFTKGPTSRADSLLLVSLGLKVLEGYFESSPIDETRFSGFNGYVQLLEQLKYDKVQGGYACRRLFELAKWDPLERYALAFLNFHFVNVAPELVKWLLNTNWPARARLLTLIYLMSQSDDQMFGYFDRILQVNEASLQQGDGFTRIALLNEATPEGYIRLFANAEDHKALIGARSSNEELLRSQERAEEISKIG